jgi:muconolactone delta-isomerase
MLKEDGPTPSLTPDEMMETLLDETDVLKEQIARGQIDAIYKMVGRPGGALLVNADSHEALFRRLTELPEYALSMFEIELIPLSDLDEAIQDVERSLASMKVAQEVAA